MASAPRLPDDPTAGADSVACAKRSVPMRAW